jgi:hypothetical protein
LKKNPAETNRLITNRKNTMPEPNIRRTLDAALASFPEFALDKRLPIGDMGPFGMVMGYRGIYWKTSWSCSFYGWE